ncbi:MAG TPA: response regulator, partial [Planctomycetota bacterium]|nr:response regulator [Planctomycetota bacterium]
EGVSVLVAGSRGAGREDRPIADQALEAWGLRVERAHGAAAALSRLRGAHAAGSPYYAVFVEEPVGPVDAAQDELKKLVARATATGVSCALVGGPLADRAAEIARGCGISTTLTRPLRRADVARFLAPQAAVPSAGPSMPVRRGAQAGPDARQILLAEDNVVNQLVVVGMLERLGYRAVVAENGARAVEAVEKGGFDLVLMDCQMPELDGYQATEEIRRIPPPRGRIPIVAVTAHAMRGDRERCLAAGMDEYLTKPVAIEDLRKVLDRFLPHELPEVR